MEIKKTYDYLNNPDDILLTAKVRSGLISRGRINYVILCLLFSSFCLVFAINAQSTFLYFCSFMVLLLGMQNIYTVFLIRKKLNEIKTNVNESADKIGIVNITFTDEVFTFSDNLQSVEYKWENFSSFFIKNGFLFLVVRNNLAMAICLDTKYFTENEFSTLKGFLKAQLPYYKQSLFR